jgi:trehalose 6-phosphate phosphatase
MMPADTVLSQCLEALSHRPNALVTDIDGTLSRIVRRPEDASVSAAATNALEALVPKLDVVAVITARDRATARRMVGADGVEYVGNYGLTDEVPIPATEGVAAARGMVTPLIAGLAGVSLEDKQVAFSVHYRNCEDPEGIRLRLLELMRPVAAATGVRVMEGKRVLEVVPRDLPDKRGAFVRLAEQRGVRGVVYMGDDLSDLGIFVELAARRAKGQLEGVGIVVRDSETDPALIEGADAGIDGVEAVEELLAALAERLPGHGG